MAKKSDITPHNAEEMRRHGAVSTANGTRAGGYVSYEQFLDWADEDTLAEWVDGAVVMISPASLRHQLLGEFLRTILSSFVRLHGLGQVVEPPFQMKLPRSGREPDILYIAHDHLDRLRETYLDGPADLVVEIISPESVDRDRTVKFAEYQEAGVPEYWLLDPAREQAEFYQLNAEGRYEQVKVDTDGSYRCRSVPGFWLHTSWLWQQPLPDPVHTLLQIDRDAYGRYLQEHLRQAGLDS
jgi:Uma2 family endonuclease